MALTFVYTGPGDLGTDSVRLGSISGLSCAADKGSYASSGLSVDDPTGSLNLIGLKTVRVEETTATPQRIFTGYAADRTVERYNSLVNGAARRWDVSLVDINAIFGFRIVTGTDGKRPAETDIERITWLLGSSYLTSVNDYGLIDEGSPKDMDPEDYRGRYAADVLSDCSNVSGKNHFAYYDEDEDGIGLAYFAATSSLYSSSLRFTNILGDIDNTTTFGVEQNVRLSRDPSRVYSGVYFAYGDSTAAVYRTDATTAATWFARDVAASSASVKTVAKATTLADKYLDDSDGEQDTINCVVKLPAAQVNDAREGQRVQVKFAHLPSYSSSYTYLRIVRRSVSQVEETDQFFSVTFELGNPRMISTFPAGVQIGIQRPPPADLNTSPPPYIPSADPPLSGQSVLNETVGVGDGTTTVFFTDWPYAPGSLQVFINGIGHLATESDSETGEFTLSFAPTSSETIVVSYQGE